MKRPPRANFKNLKGQRFGRLTVLRNSDERCCSSVVWICLCLCGNFTKVSGNNLSKGHTRSCGCLARDVLIKRNFKHGYATKERLYAIWKGMRKRCYNQGDSHYRWYGKRGIKICNKWHEYVPFRAWALNNGYKEDLTIDRINNNGNYEPSNCRWIPGNENTKEKRVNK